MYLKWTLLVGLSSTHLVLGFVPNFCDRRYRKVSPGIARSTAKATSGPFGLSWNLKNPFETLNKKPDPGSEARAKLKDELFQRCALDESEQKRELMEETIEELAKLSQADFAAKSPLLKREWKL